MTLVKQSDTILQNVGTRVPGMSTIQIAYPDVSVIAYVGDVAQPMFDANGDPIDAAITNNDGYYEFWIEEGDYTLRFTASGTDLGEQDYSLFNPLTGFKSPRNYGAVIDGSTNDRTAVVDTFSGGGMISMPDGDYYLSATVVPAAADTSVSIGAGTTFINSTLDLRNLIPIIGAYPAVGFDVVYKDVTTDFDEYVHVVGSSRFLKASSAGSVSVAYYGNGHSSVTGASVFGANFGCYVTAAGARGVACELDSHVTVAGTEAYSLALVAVGSFNSTAALVVSNNTAAGFNDVVVYDDNGGVGLTTGSLHKMTSGTVNRIFEFGSITATTSEMELPSFIVGPTVSGATGVVRIDASAAATPTIKSTGSATNSSLLIQGKGTGGVNLVDGGAATKFRINTTGIGFYGTTPVAKPSVTGSRGGNAALASLLTAGANMGLWTDSTTA